MNMTHPDVLDTEKHGMPCNDTPNPTCPNCERVVDKDALRQCPHCSRWICVKCGYILLEVSEVFCGEDVTTVAGDNKVVPLECMERWLLEKWEKEQDRRYELESRL